MVAESALPHSCKGLGHVPIRGDATVVVVEEEFDWVEVSWCDEERPNQPNRWSTAEVWPDCKRAQSLWWRMSQLMGPDDWEIALEVSTVKLAERWEPEAESALNVGCNMRWMAW